MGHDGQCIFSVSWKKSDRRWIRHKTKNKKQKLMKIEQGDTNIEEFLVECKHYIPDFDKCGNFTSEYSRFCPWTRNGGSGIPFSCEFQHVSNKFPTLEITVSYEDLIYDIAGVYTLQNGCMLTCDQHSPREQNWKHFGGDKKVLDYIFDVILNNDDSYNTIDEVFNTRGDVVKYCMGENDDSLDMFIEDMPGLCYEMDIPEDEDRVQELFSEFIQVHN